VPASKARPERWHPPFHAHHIIWQHTWFAIESLTPDRMQSGDTALHHRDASLVP
jgi:hypothetical protein